MFLFILGLILGALFGALTYLLSDHTLLSVAVAAIVAVITWTIRRILRWISDAADLGFDL